MKNLFAGLKPFDHGGSDLTKERTQLILFVLAAVIAALRLQTYSEPLERDIGVYQVLADLLRHGARLFEGVTIDQKPPMVECTWIFAQTVAGYGRGSVYFLNVLAGVASLIGYFFAGRLAGGTNKTGIWAAAVWTVVSGHLLLEANQPNTEVFINAFDLFAFGLMAGIAGNQRCLKKILLIGACFAAASLYKHTLVVIPFFVGCAYIAFPPEGRTRRRAALDMLIIGAVGGAAWSLMTLYFWATGRLPMMVLALFKYNLAYSSSSSGGPLVNVIHSFVWNRLFPRSLYFAVPLILLGVSGIAIALKNKRFSPWIWLAGLALGTQVAVALSGRFFPHYYQLWFPFLIVSAAWGLTAFERFTEMPRRLTVGVAGLVLMILVWGEAPDYLFKSPEDWSFAKYKQQYGPKYGAKYGAIFIRSDLVANLILKILLPEETFYQLGSEPQLYVLTGRHCPSLITDDSLGRGPLGDWCSKRIFEDLAGHPPDLFVFSKLATVSRNHPIFKWVEENYRLAPGIVNLDPFVLLVRKGSPLEKRLEAGK